MIPHVEIETCSTWNSEAYKTLKTGPIPCVSYPYEQFFSQLKDAAMTMLKNHYGTWDVIERR